jgi:hypothetical protein
VGGAKQRERRAQGGGERGLLRGAARRTGVQPSTFRYGRAGGRAAVCAGSKLRCQAGRRGHGGCAASVQRRNAGSGVACGSQRRGVRSRTAAPGGYSGAKDVHLPPEIDLNLACKNRL